MSAHTREAETAHFPIRPQCKAYFAPSRAQSQGRPFAVGPQCKNAAVAIITNVAGKSVPGSWVCWDHGAAVLGEYAMKLGEQWGAIEIVTEKED